MISLWIEGQKLETKAIQVAALTRKPAGSRPRSRTMSFLIGV